MVIFDERTNEFPVNFEEKGNSAVSHQKPQKAEYNLKREGFLWFFSACKFCKDAEKVVLSEQINV